MLVLAMPVHKQKCILVSYTASSCEKTRYDLVRTGCMRASNLTTLPDPNMTRRQMTPRIPTAGLTQRLAAERARAFFLGRHRPGATGHTGSRAAQPQK